MGYTDDKNESNWFYVHFLTQNLQEIRKIINITNKDFIFANTYILYLNEDQLEKIKNISLVKKLEPSDKFIEDGISIERTKFFYIITSPNYSLPVKPELYQVESYLSELQRYIIKISEKGNKVQSKKEKIIKFLTSISSVKLVSTFSLPELKNSINVGFTQKNVPINLIMKDNKLNIYYLPRYINDQGITGKDQIITIVDNDIDKDHAMFRDERKFVGYYGHFPEFMEHGTPIAATAAGKSICSNDTVKGTSYFNGMAPDAKILFINFHHNSSAYYATYIMEKHDSYISSNSWGFNIYNYMYSFEYGHSAYYNDNILFIFAAGNSYNKSISNVCDPGGSKSVLTVGAIDEFYDSDRSYKVEVIDNQSLQFTAHSIVNSDPWIEGYVGKNIKIIDATMPNVCKQINRSMTNILYGPEDANFSKVLLCNDYYEIYYEQAILYTYDVSIMKMIKTGNHIKITDITPLNLSKTIEHSPYSSQGPANKGIIKPDVVAPGTRIISANYNKHSSSSQIKGCREEREGDFRFISGTSIATPIVAGAAALIKEYFQTGRWSGGNYTLNACTLRALLINSCRHPKGRKKPDSLFGHGVVDVSNVLPFDGSFGVQISDQINVPTISHENYVVAQLEVKSNNVDLHITMSYTDHVTIRESIYPIDKDIDLVLISPTGRRFFGDHLHNNDTQHFSTNEKIILNKNEIEIGIYLVYVANSLYIPYIREDKMRFSVVATGDIDNKVMIFRSPIDVNLVQISDCPCETCNYSRCVCDENHIGNLCQTEIIHTNGQKVSILIYDSEMRTIKVSSKKPQIVQMSVKIIGSLGGNTTIWIDDICHTSIHEYYFYYGIDDIMKGPIVFNEKKKDFCITVFNNNFEPATFEIDFKIKKSYTGLIVGVVFGVIALVIILILAVFLFKKGVCDYCYCPSLPSCSCPKIKLCPCSITKICSFSTKVFSCCNKNDIDDNVDDLEDIQNKKAGNLLGKAKKGKSIMKTNNISSPKREYFENSSSLEENDDNYSSTSEINNYSSSIKEVNKNTPKRKYNEDSSSLKENYDSYSLTSEINNYSSSIKEVNKNAPKREYFENSSSLEENDDSYSSANEINNYSSSIKEVNKNTPKRKYNEDSSSLKENYDSYSLTSEINNYSSSIKEVNKNTLKRKYNEDSSSEREINNYRSPIKEKNKSISQRNSDGRITLGKKRYVSSDDLGSLYDETEESIHQRNEKISPFPVLGLNVIQSYDNEKKIGSGATSTVYKLRKKSNPKIVRALKVLDKEYLKIPDKMEYKKKAKASSEYDFEKFKRFVQECEVLNQINHPNIIKSYGIFLGDINHEPAILLEYCETNLKKQIKILNQNEQISIIVSLCHVMKMIHSVGIIHRDLKLENILIDSNKNVKLSDFGICTFINVDNTRTEMPGTLKYMAPELLDGRTDYDEKVDVYAFGVVIFLILTKGVFPSISISEVVTGKKAVIPSSISKFSSKLIKDCWSFDSNDRPLFSDICLMLKGNEHKLIKYI